MQSTDREQFTAQVKILCAGFNVPLGDRIEAYWTAMQKMTLVEFARVVEYALGESGPEKLPTTGQLWRIKRSLRTGPAPETIDVSFASIEEQLCAYASLHCHDRAGPTGMSLREFSRPWTYVYREWTDPAAKKKDTNPEGKCAECIGLVIELDNGKRIGWSVARMISDREGYEKMRKSFTPGPQPSREQLETWRGATKKTAVQLTHMS